MITIAVATELAGLIRDIVRHEIGAINQKTRLPEGSLIRTSSSGENNPAGPFLTKRKHATGGIFRNRQMLILTISDRLPEVIA